MAEKVDASEVIPFPEVIQFIGVDILEDHEKDIANKLSNEYYDKFKRSLNNLTSLIVQVKDLGKGGKVKKYSIHAKILAPGHTFEADKACDYDFARALHKAFKDLENEIRHRFHGDDQKPKDHVGSRRIRRMLK